MKNILIVGAGEAGKMVARELQSDYHLFSKYKIIGYVDDNESIKDVYGIPVLGPISGIKYFITEFNIHSVFIAIPSASSALINKIIQSINGCNVEIKIIPGFIEFIEGTVSFKQFKDFDITDLLGREEVTFEIEKISNFYKDKTIFVSGAGGSIGSEIFTQLLNLPIKKAIAFGHGENSIYELIQKVGKDSRFQYCIGDVRDYEKLDKELKRFKPDIVFHAAAHKHVPLMEDYPDEAVKNNVLGTFNMAKASIENNVKKFLLISTDKAVNPTSVMGCTKRIAEKIILSLNKLNNTTSFSLTRFGNVLGSRGSVVPIFKKQIEAGGPVTVTHPEMTRFFMSIREASRLVIKSATIDYGNIFILDMGKPIKIYDLAKTMIKLSGYSTDEIKIEYTGIRPGEKLNEEVLTAFEEISKSKFDKIFISTEMDQFYNSIEEIEKFVNYLVDISNKLSNEEIKKIIFDNI